MRTYKENLPKGIRKKFDIKLGHKVRIINKLYCKDNVKEDKPAKTSK